PASTCSTPTSAAKQPNGPRSRSCIVRASACRCSTTRWGRLDDGRPRLAASSTGAPLEDHGLDKGQFDDAQGLIAECRRQRLLPMDIVAEDDARAFENLEEIDELDAIAFAAALCERVKYLIEDLDEDEVEAPTELRQRVEEAIKLDPARSWDAIMRELAEQDQDEAS